MSHDFAAVGLNEVINCCGHKHEVKLHSQVTMSEKVFYVVQKLSAIALGAFTAGVFPVLFFPMFACGVALGLVIPADSVHQHGSLSSCSQGFLEQTIGVRLPDTVALVAGFGVTAVHIDHHPEVFARIAGVTVGMKIGQLVRAGFDLCYRKVVSYSS